MSKYECNICGYVFEEKSAGEWDKLPNDWLCPVCGADKSNFTKK